jgi:hypothetical protein
MVSRAENSFAKMISEFNGERTAGEEGFENCGLIMDALRRATACFLKQPHDLGLWKAPQPARQLRRN